MQTEKAYPGYQRIFLACGGILRPKPENAHEKPVVPRVVKAQGEVNIMKKHMNAVQEIKTGKIEKNVLYFRKKVV